MNAQEYTHTINGIFVTLKKVYGNVATCYSSETTVITQKPYLETNIIVCRLSSLKPISK